LGLDDDLESFWELVDNNLKQGRIRLVITGDELRPEVRRSIEYLNKEMQNAEVLGLEIRCYGVEPGPIILVPYVVGYSVTGTASKPSGSKRLWRPEQLKAEYAKLDDQRLSDRLLALLDWAVKQGFFVTGPGRTELPGFGLRGRSGQRIVSIFPEWVQVLLDESRYEGFLLDRQNLVNDLKTLGMYEATFDPDKARHASPELARSLNELTENEFAQFLSVLAKYCVKAT
jgi:hypothetical protein